MDKSKYNDIYVRLATDNITDPSEVKKIVLSYGVSEEEANMIVNVVQQYEKSNVFDARKLSEVNFRKICNELLLVYDISPSTKALIANSGFVVEQEDNAMLVLCYIDHNAGISFELIALARRSKDGETVIGHTNTSAGIKFRIDSFDGKVEVVPGTLKLTKDMVTKVTAVADGYKVSESVNEIRMLKKIDHLRAPGFPDDLLVVLAAEGIRPEGVWCRVEDTDEENKVIKMKMLNEPRGRFGKHIGDIVDVRLAVLDDGDYWAYIVLE